MKCDDRGLFDDDGLSSLVRARAPCFAASIAASKDDGDRKSAGARGLALGLGSNRENQARPGVWPRLLLSWPSYLFVEKHTIHKRISNIKHPLPLSFTPPTGLCDPPARRGPGGTSE